MFEDIIFEELMECVWDTVHRYYNGELHLLEMERKLKYYEYLYIHDLSYIIPLIEEYSNFCYSCIESIIWQSEWEIERYVELEGLQEKDKGDDSFAIPQMVHIRPSFRSRKDYTL